jgi:hypothetical protein
MGREVKVVLGIPGLISRKEGGWFLGGIMEIGQIVPGLKGE